MTAAALLRRRRVVTDTDRTEVVSTLEEAR